MLIFLSNNELITPIQTNQPNLCKTTDASSSKNHPNEVPAKIPTRPTISSKKPTLSDGNFQDRQVPFSLFQTPTYPLTTKANLQQCGRKPLRSMHEGVPVQPPIPHPDTFAAVRKLWLQERTFPHLLSPCLPCQDSANTPAPFTLF